MTIDLRTLQVDDWIVLRDGSEHKVLAAYLTMGYVKVHTVFERVGYATTVLCSWYHRVDGELPSDDRPVGYVSPYGDKNPGDIVKILDQNKCVKAMLTPESAQVSKSQLTIAKIIKDLPESTHVTDGVRVWFVIVNPDTGKRELGAYDDEGTWLDSEDCTYLVIPNLRVKPKKLTKEYTRWVNVYDNQTKADTAWATREYADAMATPLRIACVEVKGSYEVDE